MTRKQARDFKAFKEQCSRWRVRLGLLDWRVTYGTQVKPPEYGAHIMIDCECRGATILYNLGRDPTSFTIDELAAHEILHLALADHVEVAAKRGARLHDDVGLEEHKLIERLLGVLIRGR